ncbi:Bcr/CflA family efflux MFS transporter [Vibrio astriarenae]|uniref:Bcr/CflA family efflux transporter n=1 Tax=Vibrio astriarenae TaxID=1481923 RepID=A0A7Z2T5M7_9VIBR|nr:multidrug effflux MFS transporter [Vibrio astriarenae]QIA64612.1 Bcr/CflA family efflux MFS transporter [Vibrio astriarenae]
MPSPTCSKSMIAVLALLVLFSPLGIDIYLPALPEIGAEFHVEPTLVKDTITWFMIAMGVGQLFTGPLADSVGRKQVALIGASIYGVASVLAWFSSSIEWLLVARILQGLGACATSVAAFASVRDIYGAKESGKMISYLNGIICFIPAMAPILGAWLTEWFGWRANFTTMAVFALVVGLIVLVLMPSEKRSDEAVKVVNVQHYKDVLSHPSFLFHASMCLIAMGVILGYVTAAPNLLMGQLGLSMSEFTVWFTINACINIAACFIGPRFLQSMGAYRTLIIGISLLVFAAVLMAYGANNATPMAFMLPVFIASTGFAFILGAAAGQALAPFGDKAGTASALLGLFQMTGAGLLVTLTQGWFEQSSHHMVFLMLLSAPGLLVLMTQSAKRWHGEIA